MPGPGEYVPDATEGITCVEDLPKPKILRRKRDHRRQPVRVVGTEPIGIVGRICVLHDVGDLVSGRPHDIHLTYSVHYCTKCRKYFNADMADLALPKSHYTHRVVALAVRVVVEDGLPYQVASWHLWRDHRVFVPWATIQNWVEAGGKKAEAHIEAEYLDWALADFTGYIAADELYDGPYCVLSIVDNRTFKRILYRVLDHDPTHADIREFFSAFRAALETRGLLRQGITTDGSPLYPQPIAEVFPGVRHQVCEFHVLAEINKAVLHAGAKVRKQLACQKEPLGRGRPHQGSQAGGPAELASATEDWRVVRASVSVGCPPPHSCRTQNPPAHHPRLASVRTLREIMDEVYRLFDRRCRTDTGLAKLAKLRMRVRRFRHVGKTLSKLFSPNLEKALTFLDDKLLPATSNAVERGNRRHRKMQKTVYRVRTQEHIHARIAIDMLRDAQAHGRFDTTQTLHEARAG